MRMLAENIWVAEKDFSMMGAELGNRMTVVALNDDNLVIHSPNALDDTTRAQIDELGTVTYIVTPNRFHGLFADAWLKVYPQAEHYAVNSVQDKFDGPLFILNDLNYSPWAPQLLMMHISGLEKVNEFAFFHPQSRTLILTDLCFNIHKDVSLWSRAFLRMNDSYKKFGPSRLMKSMVSNDEKLGRAISDILEWNFDRIVLSHGNIVESGGKEKLKKAFSTYLKDVGRYQES